MTKPPSPAPAARRRYEKPVLRRFSLEAEEVLARGCKMAGGGMGSFTGAGCLPGGCFQTGS